MYLNIFIIISVLFYRIFFTTANFRKYSKPMMHKRKGDIASLKVNNSDPVYRDQVFTSDSSFIPSTPVRTPRIYKNKSWNITETSPKNSVIHPFSCAAVMGYKGNPGVYLIRITNSNLQPFFVYCERDPKGGSPWTVIQRRVNGLFNFNRYWSEYKEGFGHIESNFWLGLKRIHALTTAAHHELWIEMQDWKNNSFSAKYSSFAIGDEDQIYALNILGSYSGNAGDSLLVHAGQKFSTIDFDNDDLPDASCAKQFKGGWWFRACYKSYLNGLYVTPDMATVRDGIKWNSLHGDTYSMYFAQMAIRPKK